MNRFFIVLGCVTFLATPALANTYGRVSGGQALDVITGQNLTAALSGRFAEGYNPQPYWTQIPDTDTGGKPLQSGATDNGNGSFTNAVRPVAKPTVITALDFIRRFTLSERAAIIGSNDNVVKAFQFELTKADNVDLTDPDTVQGTNYLEAQAIIAAGRAAQILTP